MRRGAALAVAPAVMPALLLAVLLAGCGSPELSDLQLHKRAGAICAATATRAGRIRTPRTASGSAAFLRAGIAVLTRELVALRRLRPPADLKADYDGSVAAISSQVDELRLAVHSLASGEDPVIAIKTLQHRLAPLEAAASRSWRASQVPACATQQS